MGRRTVKNQGQGDFSNLPNHTAGLSPALEARPRKLILHGPGHTTMKWQEDHMRRPLLIGLILGTGVLVGWCSNNVLSSAGPRPITRRGPLESSEQALIERFREARPSVVFITSIQVQQGWFFEQDVRTGTGSGFIWDESGHIVTNFHVVEGADELSVTLSDQSVHSARVVGIAPEKDLAVLRMAQPPSPLRPVPIGTSGDLQVGQSVMAIGNPFGLDSTLTTGIVSALGREIQSPTRRRISGVIQTDAAINPGNSGGPLLDSAGRLIGVNTAIQSPSGASAGIGFAVPVDTVNRIVPQLISRGRAARPELGFEALPEAYAGYFGRPRGIIVMNVKPGGAAAKAGLQGLQQSGRRYLLGDVILSANGKPMDTMDRLLDLAFNEPMGSTLELEVLRGERKIRLTLRLEAARALGA